MDKKFKSYLTAALRRLSYQRPEREDCLNGAKKRTKVGKYKNGNDKYLNMFQCATCRQSFDRKGIQVDHIAPVIDKTVGFVDWNTYINRLFCGVENLQVLCKRCHNIKTQREN